jgi:CBS domain-containing protein
MTPEVAEVAKFVALQAPFSQLPEAATHYFVSHLEIVYLNKDNQSQWLKSVEPNLYLVRSGQYDLVNGKEEVVAQLAEGDYFGFPSLLTGDAIQNRIEVSTPGLIYILSQTGFDFLRREYKAFEQHFVRAHANRLLSSHYQQKSDNWSEKKISELLTREAITLGPEATIRDAAVKMSHHGVSSIMVTEQESLIGVLTDRDLRNRVLAKEVDPSVSINQVMTAKPKFIFENNRVFSALHLMLKHNIHHLPVLDENYMPLGMLTSTDLLRQQKKRSSATYWSYL